MEGVAVSWIGLYALSPVIALSIAAVVVMLVSAWDRRHHTVALLTLAGLIGAAVLIPVAIRAVPQQVTELVVVDRYALFFLSLILIAGFATTVLAHTYLEARRERLGAALLPEFYILLLLAVTGAAVVVVSAHFAAFLLGLEILAMALFGMVAYPTYAERSLEAGIKYLVLAGLSSALLLFGMALVYAKVGIMAFGPMADALVLLAEVNEPLVMMGMAFILAGIGFKLSFVPFHMWTPDVYEGAPAPATAFLATVSKGAVFALLLRWFLEVELFRYEPVVLALTLVAVATMLAGNLLALLQDNVKRLLAYSSIAHLGYLLVALLSAGQLAVEAVGYFLVAYFVTTMGAFGVVSLLSSNGSQRDADHFDDYQGLFWQRPWLAGIFTIMLLSLAGIPLTVGFVGKFYLFAAGVNAALWVLILTMAVGSAIGLFYYLRLVAVMYQLPVPEAPPAAPPARALGSTLLLAVLTVLLLWFGVYPSALIDVIRANTLGVV